MSKLEELIARLCPDGVEYKELGGFCEIKTGKGITKKDSVSESDYPIISGGKEPMGYYKTFNREANTVTVSRVGANAGYVDYITKLFYLNDKCFSVIPKDIIISKFLYYAIKAKENAITEMQSEGGVPTINTKKLSSVKLPVPPLEVQREIVHILDSYTASNNELKEQLEKELAARQKQYEFYRDALLTFKNIDDTILNERTNERTRA